jgi:hypothetical protein
MCGEMAARAGPPGDERYRDLAMRLRASSRQGTAFVEWEDKEIRRLFGPDVSEQWRPPRSARVRVRPAGARRAGGPQRGAGPARLRRACAAH